MEKITLKQTMTFYKVSSDHILAAQGLRGLLTGLFLLVCLTVHQFLWIILKREKRDMLHFKDRKFTL